MFASLHPPQVCIPAPQRGERQNVGHYVSEKSSVSAPAGCQRRAGQRKWVRLLLSSPSVHQRTPSTSFTLAIITPVSLAHQHSDSFSANQVQLMIISCPVSPHPRQAPACTGLEDKGQSQCREQSGVHCTRWPSAWLFFPLAGH